MITYWLLIILTGILQVVISPLLLLPNVALDPRIATSLATAGHYTAILDMVIPVWTLFTIFVLYVVIEAAIFGYKIIKWIYSKIPGIS